MTVLGVCRGHDPYLHDRPRPRPALRRRMGTMDVTAGHDPAQFIERTRGFLTSRPIEHNVLATVAATLEPTHATQRPLFAWVEGTAGEVVGAALRTPPRRLLVSTMNAEAAGALVPKLLEVDPELPGVNGPQPAASHVAEAWRKCAGGTVKPLMSQAIYWLEHVHLRARHLVSSAPQTNRIAISSSTARLQPRRGRARHGCRVRSRPEVA